MSWTNQPKATSGDSAPGWGDLPWGSGPWGSPSGTAWSKQSKASDSWTTVSNISDSWTKQTKAS